MIEVRYEIAVPLLRRRANQALVAASIIFVNTGLGFGQEKPTVSPISGAKLPTNTVVTTVTVGSKPYGAVVSPSGATVYVVNNGSNSVTPINAVNNQAGTPIPVGSFPEFAAITPDGKTLYVSNTGDGTVSVISTASGSVNNTLTVGQSPEGVAVSPDGKAVYVANEGDGTVSIIDTSNNQVSASPITVGGEPYLVAFAPDGTQAYILNFAGVGFISVVETSSQNILSSTFGAGEIFSPEGIAVSPTGATIVVTDEENFLATIDNAGALKKAVLLVPVADEVNETAEGLPVVTPNGKWVYVANFGADTVTMVSTKTSSVVGTPIPVGAGPFYMAASPNGKLLYVDNNDGNSVTVIDIAP